MADNAFKVWRILEETEPEDKKVRTITKKEFVGEIVNPKEEICVTWMELVECFGEGYYLVEIPREIYRRYLVPEKQFVRTSAYFEPSSFVRREGSAIAYDGPRKTAGLQADQLKRYETRLSQTCGKYFLIFLAPSKYKLPLEAEAGCRERFVKISYKDLSDWTDEYLRASALPPFERCYFQEFHDFTRELEMKPLSDEDLSALSRYKSSVNAFKKIGEITTLLGKPESSRDYILVRKEPVSGFPLYLGFRLTSDWYFNAPLLSESGEVIAYVKDEEADSEIARKFALAFEGAIANLGFPSDVKSKCEYFPRYEQPECRLVFRRSLVDFVGQDPSRITDWINEKADSLQRILEAAQESVRGSAGSI